MHTRKLTTPETITVLGKPIELDAERLYFSFQADPQTDGSVKDRLVVSRALGTLVDPTLDPSAPGNFQPASQWRSDDIVIIDDNEEIEFNPAFDPEQPASDENPTMIRVPRPDFSELSAPKGPKKEGQFRTDDVVSAFDKVITRRKENQ